MGFKVKLENGKYDWSVYASAYGCAGGVADTLEEAKVEMAIAESYLYEQPYPPAVVKIMRSDYPKFAADWPDPEIS